MSGEEKHCEILVLDSLKLWDQGLDIINRLSTSLYCHVEKGQNSSVGAHYRHAIDHYLCLFKGLKNNQVDYDDRIRQSDIECSLDSARTVISQIKKELETLKITPMSRSLLVNQSSGDKQAFTSSSLGRELQVLFSHTVHHFALISQLLRETDVDLPPNFGIAPSTIEYNKKQCAP